MLNPLTVEWALRAPVDFTLSNARRFYASMGNPLDGKGLTTPKTMSPLNKVKDKQKMQVTHTYNLIEAKIFMEATKWNKMKKIDIIRW